MKKRKKIATLINGSIINKRDHIGFLLIPAILLVYLLSALLFGK